MTFLDIPQINSTSSAFTLTSEIISQDSLNIFIWVIISGISLGLLFGIFKKITYWIWK